MSEERTFIRVEDLKIKCVTVVLLQNDGIWAACCFDNNKKRNEFVNFNNFDAAMTYADRWMRQKRQEHKSK